MATTASPASPWKQRKIALALSTLLLVSFLANLGPGVLRREQLQYGERDAALAEQDRGLRGAGRRERLWSAAIAALEGDGSTATAVLKPPKHARRRSGTRANAQRLAEVSRPALSFVVFIRDRFELLVNCTRASLGHRRSGGQLFARYGGGSRGVPRRDGHHHRAACCCGSHSRGVRCWAACCCRTRSPRWGGGGIDPELDCAESGALLQLN